MNQTLRKVEYTLREKLKDGSYQRFVRRGKFHTWGQRGDETWSQFFGVVETESGNCLELDPSQIIFEKED